MPPVYTIDLIGAPGTIRTCDRLVRSQVLYPAELRARGGETIGRAPECVKAGRRCPLRRPAPRH
jgi:hypothetical protein